MAVLIRTPALREGFLPNENKLIKPGFFTGSSFWFEIQSQYDGIPGINWKPMPALRRGLQAHRVGPNKTFARRINRIFTSFPSYGIVDNPQQFIDRYAFLMARSHEPLCAFFRYGGKPSDGIEWRWHKQGSYLGNQGKPQCEYYMYEKGFENGVWFFEICTVKLEATTEQISAFKIWDPNAN